MTTLQKPEKDRTWEESVEFLAGLLAGQDQLKPALQSGLVFILDRLHLESGLILAPEWNKGDPLICLGVGNTRHWENQIRSPESFLNSLLLKAADTPGGEIVSDSAGKVIIFPLISADGSQGLLLINLKSFVKQEKDFLEAASFLLGQRISYVLQPIAHGAVPQGDGTDQPDFRWLEQHDRRRRTGNTVWCAVCGIFSIARQLR